MSPKQSQNYINYGSSGKGIRCRGWFFLVIFIMSKQKISVKKAVSLVLIAILLTNMILLAFKKVSQLYFWISIAVIAVIAYKFVPKIKS